MAGPGQPKTGGRQRGTPNKTSAAVKDAISSAFEEVGGKDYLVQIARSDPKVFCSLLAKLIPGQIRAEFEASELPIVSIKDYTGFSREEALERWRRDQDESQASGADQVPPEYGQPANNRQEHDWRAHD